MLIASEIKTIPGRVECKVLVPSEQPFQLYFEYEGNHLSSNADWVVASLLLPAMSMGENLQVEGPVSPRLTGNLDTIQDILSWWKPSAKKIRVNASSQDEESAGTGTGLFFSGGVDSLYSLVKHQDQVTHLILVHGFDVPISDTASFQPCHDGAAKIADQLGKKLCIVRTNVRAFSDRYCGWGIYHGGGLAAVSLILKPEIHQTIIGSSYTYGQLHPWGSHPLLDPLWSTASQKILHDGAEANRIQKTRLIAEYPWSLGHLRVCWEEASAYNCGKCEKCLRTMIGLKIAGKLESCPVLPSTIDLKLVRNMELTAGSSIFWEEFENQVTDAQLREAIRVAMMNYRRGLPPDTGTLHSKARRIKATAKRMMKAIGG